MVYHNSMFLKKLSRPDSMPHQSNWREKLGEFLESKPEQIAIFLLIVLDLLVIVTQLFIIEPYVKCNNTSSSHEHISSHGEPENLAMERAEKALDYISLAILCILGLEMALLLVAFDVRFFKQPLYILDAFVIGASLFIEIEGKAQAGALLIFFRLWRIVRIVHGVAMSVQEKNEEQIKHLEAEVNKLTEEKTKLATKFDYIKKRYKKLIDATKEDMENTPVQNIPSNRTLLDDEAMMFTPPSYAPSISSPFKSPGAPHVLHHQTIRINDNVAVDKSADVDTIDDGAPVPVKPAWRGGIAYNTFKDK